MRIRATIQLRNDALVAARKRKGWTQKETAELCGVGLGFYQALEQLRFQKTYRLNDLYLIADTLEIDNIDDIWPEAMVGWDGQTRFEHMEEVPVARLLEYKDRQKAHYMLPSPSDEVEENEQLNRMRALIEAGLLSEKERAVLELRYGLTGKEPPLTLGAVGRRFNRSEESVRMLEAKAIRKLQNYASNKGLMARIDKSL